MVHLFGTVVHLDLVVTVKNCSTLPASECDNSEGWSALESGHTVDHFGSHRAHSL